MKSHYQRAGSVALLLSISALSACGGGGSVPSPFALVTHAPTQPGGAGTPAPGGGSGGGTPAPGGGGGGGTPAPGGGGATPTPTPTPAAPLAVCVVGIGNSCTPTSVLNLGVGSLLNVDVSGTPAGSSISAALNNGALATVLNLGNGQFQIVGDVAGATAITFSSNGLSVSLPINTTGVLPLPINLPNGNVLSLGVLGLNAAITSIPASNISSVTSSNSLVAAVVGPLLGQYTVLTAGTGTTIIQINLTNGTTEDIGLTINP